MEFAAQTDSCVWTKIPLVKTVLVALAEIASDQNPSEYPSGRAWLNKDWYIHTMEYYATIKKSEAAVWLWDDN